MEVTSVEVHKIEKENSKIRGIARIVLDNCFSVNSIRIIEGEKGLFCAMPSRKTATGESRDYAHPINEEARAMIEAPILKAYEEAE